MKKIFLLILVSIVVLCSCSDSLKGTMWENDISKQNRERLYSNLIKKGYSDVGNYEYFINKLSKESSRRKLWEKLSEIAPGFNLSFEDFSNEMGFGSGLYYPIVEFLSGNTVVVSDLNNDNEKIIEYYHYKIDYPVVEIFKQYNKKVYPIYNGRIQNDTTLILSFANDFNHNMGKTYATLSKK